MTHAHFQEFLPRILLTLDVIIGGLNIDGFIQKMPIAKD